MGDENEHALLLQQKAKFFKDNDKRVHITFKNPEKLWKRGYVIDVRADFFMLWEDHLKQEIPCFYLETKFIDEFTYPVEKEVLR